MGGETSADPTRDLAGSKPGTRPYDSTAGALAAVIQIMTTYTLIQYIIPGDKPMPKEAVFTMKLEPELRDAFMAEAEASHRPASQIVRELMREFVQRQSDAREYDAFLRGKVTDARREITSGRYASAEDVEARSATRRAELLAKAGDIDA